jgi:holin-like protein
MRRPRLPTASVLLAHARGAAVLLVLLVIGNELSSVLHLPLPGSVLGMVMLAAALRLRVVPERWLSPFAELLIRHMALLYIPPGVGVMAYWGLVRREWLPLVAAGVVGMAAVLVVVGRVQQGMERRG